MNNKYLVILICLAALFCPVTAQGQVSVVVDRNQLALDETLNLTISKDSSSSISDNELKPLEKNFRIVGKSRSSNKQYVNGTWSSSFTMELVLSPKRAGVLEIPALSIGKEKSERLMVKVVTQAQPKTKADNSQIFIETEVDQQSIFVQSQVIFTLRIFWAVEANISEPADPQINDALIERLKDTTFNKVINGISYKVFERKFAIFPQKSGVLEIPQVVVEATVPTQRSRQGSLYGFFGNRGKVVKLRSESTSVVIKKKPAGYPLDAEWLPTNKLSVAEEWSKNPSELQEGESATVTIALAATGMLGAQLPPIELVETEGVKLYQGKAEIQNITNSTGVTGIRKESIALIPLRPGQIEFPEIRIPWWNNKQQIVEYAVIPARKLQVKAAPVNSVKAAADPSPIKKSETSVDSPTTIANSAKVVDINKPLLVLCVVLFLALLTTIFLLLKTRRQMTAFMDNNGLETEMLANFNESETFKNLSRACRVNDPALARKALVDWVRAFYPQENVQTGADLDKVAPNSNLPVLLAEIDEILYKEGGKADSWQGRKLMDTVVKIRKNDGNKIKRKSTLQKLYQ